MFVPQRQTLEWVGNPFHVSLSVSGRTAMGWAWAFTYFSIRFNPHDKPLEQRVEPGHSTFFSN